MAGGTVAPDNLEETFGKILQGPSTPMSHSDRNVELALANLGLAVIRLDKTSAFLAKVNIGLGFLVIAVGIFQICLMLRGH